jgi:hypothetical protein
MNYAMKLSESEMSISSTIATNHFGHIPVTSRTLDPGMGIAVARRTVFREGDDESFGRVADRVAAGNMSLLGHPLMDDECNEQKQLRNAIATGALLTSGRHLQHGDMSQSLRNIEVFSNCATAITTFAKFYLLLNGAGVGRSYDDELIVVDWQAAPTLLLYLSPEHPDYPHDVKSQCQLGVDLGILPYGTTTDPTGIMRQYIANNFVSDLSSIPPDTIQHDIADSREGWGKAVEILEAMAFRHESNKTLLLKFSHIRRLGAPIGGMQNRPASGPVSVMRAFLNLRNHVMLAKSKMWLWEQALRIDHYFSIEVQVGGARRAARMATKSWRDRDILAFIRIKSEGGLWTANHSVMVDKTFWSLVQAEATDDPLSIHAHAVFDEVTLCAYVNGEPGFINVDKLEDHRTGSARDRPVYENGEDFQSDRYHVDEACGLLAELTRRSAVSRFPVTTNPCSEISLHVAGGVCVIADFAPLLACPLDLMTFEPGGISDEWAERWDDRIEESVRLGVRFLIRVNTMNALYGKEIARTNRIGIGPTGLHEYAWRRFGYDFNDLLDPIKSAPFWNMMERFSFAAKDESCSYSEFLGMNDPITVTTVKPAGSTSKLFGLTEGVHLPARRQYLRWVQFKGTQNSDTRQWDVGSDPRLAEYESQGYPMRGLKTFQGMTIVGFPTVPLLVRLGIGERVVTASEASPSDQYQWLRLLEKYWIGKDRGNQISYTLKVLTNNFDVEAFRTIVREHQSTVRCCAILPSKSDAEMGYEYLPEEEVSLERFVELVQNIKVENDNEEIDLVHLQCASGICPI